MGKSVDTPVRVSRLAARRFLLEKILLGAKTSRPGQVQVEEAIHALEAVQIDPVARVGRNQDLALLARSALYRPHMLNTLLEERRVFEYRANEASVIPTKDYLAFEGVRRRMARFLSSELNRYPGAMREIIHRIESQGATPSRAFRSDKKVFGYWDTASASTKESSHVINLLVDSGQLMVVRREGTTRYFDVPSHVLEQEVIQQCRQITNEEADERLFDKYLRAYRLINGRHARLGWNGHPAAIRQSMLKRRQMDGTVVAVTINQVSSPYYVLAEDVEDLQKCESAPRGWRRPIRFLPPLDNLLWDRQRLLDLFDFHYRWEVYVPSHKRRFGIYAMPVVAGDRLVGLIDPELQRDHDTLVVHNAQWNRAVRPSPTLAAAINEALKKWAAALGAEQVVWETGGMAVEDSLRLT